ncbi:uncharacterized protein LOC143292591 [Babylonia areolata]|uniref:uncharacterized protein LOC143292591 n=1 Tax=Babylonia areolata TaxID=304850 RepID=UPI003FD3388E
MRVFVLVCWLTLLAVCMGEVGRPCTQQSQCESDECCQIVNIIIASKKRQLHRPLNTSGTCQKLRQQGERCNHFDVMNGYCGCAEGLTCKTVHVNTTPAPALQRLMMMPRKMAPGYISLCSA